MNINIYSLRMVKEKSEKFDCDKNINILDKLKDILFSILRPQEWDVEKFGIVCFDTSLKIAGVHIVTTGVLNESLIHPREVFKHALLNNANKIAIFHNHPSGEVEPSKPDKIVTKTIKDAGEILGIPLLDHIILGANLYNEEKYFSFLENGLI